MKSFPSITICSVDCLNHEKAIASMLYSMKDCSFAKSIFLSDKQEVQSDKITFVKIDKITSRQQYSSFILKELNNYIDTDFVLIVQHDGFIINPSSWNDDFLKYDYIGAPWKGNENKNKVGNGGFSLRSKKLIDFISNKYKDKYVLFNEDLEICNVSYDELVKNGFKFPDIKTAFEFSIEHKSEGYNEVPFGFHGFPFTKIGMESKIKILEWMKNDKSSSIR